MKAAERAIIKRSIHLTTDDADEAFDALRSKRATGESGWDMAEVRHMEDPPKTVDKWCVFRITV